MKQFFVRLALVGALSAFMVGSAFAQVTLGAIGDADAIAGGASGNDYSDDNFGGRPWIAENWDGATDVIAHIQFDVSSFASGTVTGATLRLFQDFNGVSGITYNVFQVLDPWAEGTLTYATRPSLAATPSASLTTSSSATGWKEWDVTSLVQSWVDGGATNYGMAIIRDPNTSPWPYFRSKENTSGNNPELVVTASPVPEPATMGLAALALVSAARRRRKGKSS
ncbi:MAG: DNRLRE domain-containing protein [Chthonomonadaceae bacterium]|nr:DNRLRE domain-containing protein [Chthonomonadaceae bacterium]